MKSESKILPKTERSLPKPGSLIQPKLAINQPGDRFEVEVDRVADAVMTMQAGDPPVVQRMALSPVSAVQRQSGGEAGGRAAPPVVSEVLNSGGGRPLEADTQEFMESRFGQDFSKIQIHDGGRAAESAAAIQARAYTSGNDIVFNRGEYQPGSEAGRRLLAHELAHVGQQGEGVVKRQATRAVPATPADRREFVQHAIRFVQAQGQFFAMQTSRSVSDALRLLRPAVENGLSTIADDTSATALADQLRAAYTEAVRTVLVSRTRPAPGARARGGTFPTLQELYERHTDEILPFALPGDTYEITVGGQTRANVVYVMGNDGFYQAATRFFRARIPNATFVTNVRHLDGLMTHLNATFTSPLGNIFIISHANEDGTLAFGLDATDRRRGRGRRRTGDDRLNVVELRNALNPTSGSAGLPSVSHLVDRHTRIRIKGCDLGRNQQVVELFDQAFGGNGVVTAPTHEQGYSFHTRDIRRETERIMTEHLREFEGTLPALPDAPPRVDRTLRGEARREADTAFREATRARSQAQAARRAAIAAERRRFTPEAARLGEIAGTHDFLSGPMFQRPGTTLFTAAEIRPEVNRLYTHLSDAQRTSLVTRLIAPDRRSSREAHRQGTFRQTGQRAYRFEANFTYVDPVTEGQVRSAFARNFRADHFALDSFTTRTETTGTTTTRHYDMTGHNSRRGHQDEGMTYTASGSPVESDEALISQVQLQVNNPDKFNWRVEESRSASGILTKKVVWERVVAYLHHGSLDASRTERFTRPELDRRFFAASRFAPPPPPRGRRP